MRNSNLRAEQFSKKIKAMAHCTKNTQKSIMNAIELQQNLRKMKGERAIVKELMNEKPGRFRLYGKNALVQ